MKLVIVLWFESRLKDYIQVYGKYERNERNLRSKIMKSKKVNTEIDTLEFEIDNQELNGTSGSGWWYTAVDCVSPVPMSVRQIMFIVR